MKSTAIADAECPSCSRFWAVAVAFREGSWRVLPGQICSRCHAKLDVVRPIGRLRARSLETSSARNGDGQQELAVHEERTQ